MRLEVSVSLRSRARVPRPSIRCSTLSERLSSVRFMQPARASPMLGRPGKGVMRAGGKERGIRIGGSAPRKAQARVAAAAKDRSGRAPPLTEGVVLQPEDALEVELFGHRFHELEERGAGKERGGRRPRVKRESHERGLTGGAAQVRTSSGVSPLE